MTKGGTTLINFAFFGTRLEHVSNVFFEPGLHF